MKPDLYNTYSPCISGCVYFHAYHGTNEKCNRCAYNIMDKLLKKMTETNDGCSLCVYRYTCDRKGQLTCGYHNIDWKAAFDKYGVEYDE